ncbi:hypothetical protein [Dactylosporangium sp. NPDC006015]|uniref:hypothetical protein n=1 Tax=Dactylosporangium sp. NPDC006015 TaxID=3154576 RepID=UPI0033B91A15
MPLIGGRYRLIAEVGTGGMASVWRAVDVRLERTVAITVATVIAVLATDRADTA